MLSGVEGSQHHLVVLGVRRGHVDDVHRVVGEEPLVALPAVVVPVRRGEAEFGGKRVRGCLLCAN